MAAATPGCWVTVAGVAVVDDAAVCDGGATEWECAEEAGGGGGAGLCITLPRRRSAGAEGEAGTTAGVEEDEDDEEEEEEEDDEEAIAVPGVEGDLTSTPCVAKKRSDHKSKNWPSGRS